MLLAPTLPFLLAAQAPDYRVPDGFAVERVGELARSFLTLGFDGGGRLFLSEEGGPILWLADGDGDGAFESTGALETGVQSAQGLCWTGDVLWAVGRREGVEGLFRIAADEEHTGVRDVRALLTFASANGDEPPGEHGAHGLVVGPDGALYLSVGNHARIEAAPEPGSPLSSGYEGALLAPYYDPLGHATHVRYPCGYVARIDPQTGSWRYVCVGLRNAYDLAFDARGELFTFDSDMEWDVGLPWYRATRFLHVVEGADFGSRTGSYPWPDWYDDSLPPIVEAGRGSPTGVVVYEHASWPARYRGAVLAGDWARGRILALHLERAGASFRGQVETLLEASQGFNVTDLDVGPDGALYFTCGGRGAIGRVERLVWRGTSAPGSTPDETRASSVRAVAALDRAERELGAEPSPELGAALRASDPELRARAAFWLGRRLERSAQPALIARASAASLDADPRVRAEALRALGLARAADERGRAAILAGLAEGDRHVRAGARFAWERAVGPSASGSPNVDPILWARRWLEERRTPLDPSAATAGEPRTFYWPGRLPETVEGWLTTLRAFELALAELGANARLQGQGIDWDAALLAAFPHSDFRVSRLLANLLAARDREGAREALLAALAAEPGREQRLHYAFALVQCRSGWSRAQVRGFLSFLDEAEAWPDGGASYPGYLEAARARFSQRLDDAERLALAREGPLGGRTLARFAREVASEHVDALVPALKYAWVASASGGDESAARRERAALLVALGSARSRELAAWLRKLADESAEPRDELLRALAAQREPVDRRVLIGGLASASGATVDACADALASFAELPADARGPQAALEAARRLGSARGAKPLRLAAQWLGVEPGDDWNVGLASVERAFRARFPDVALAGASDDLGPRLEVDALAAFLGRSAARRGSTARGRELFEQASCSSCHVVAGTAFGVASLGVGPELSDVGRRFDTRALVEAVLAPSRAIADLYRTTVVITRDERRLEGRLVREDADELELLFADGARALVAREDVEERFPSGVSLMPEGLLAPYDLEDAKDLFAFLAAGRVVAEDDDRPFEPLFAGKARNLWSGDRDVWVLDGELLLGRGAQLAQSSYLVSKRTWSDFELAFDVRLSAGANSGVQLRSRVEPGAADPLGLQVDLGQGYWGSLYGSDGRGLVAAADPIWREVVDPTGWNHVFVRCVGELWTVELNGATVVELQDASSPSGLLAFQVHQGLDMEVRVARARLRDLAGR